MATVSAGLADEAEDNGLLLAPMAVPAVRPKVATNIPMPMTVKALKGLERLHPGAHPRPSPLLTSVFMSTSFKL